jgi:osmotically-inducible protein OsmY
VRAKLEEHTYFQGRSAGIQIEEHQGVLTLRGSLPSFYLKQLLQTVVRDIEGVGRVDNQVVVASSDGMNS